MGVYQTGDDIWALFDLPAGRTGDTNLFSASNLNLTIFSEKEIPPKVADCLIGITPKIGYEQLGIFAYPLGACLLVAVFITLEKLFSLRRGVTFPRKVEKALLRENFLTKNGNEDLLQNGLCMWRFMKASEDTIRAYARLEISAMERGMFCWKLS